MVIHLQQQSVIHNIDINNPNFQSIDTNDWRDYISFELRNIWSTFTPDQRTMLARNALRIFKHKGNWQSKEEEEHSPSNYKSGDFI